MGYPTTVDTGQVQPWILDGASQLVSNGTAALTANTVYVWAEEVQANVTITGMRWRMTATTTGNTSAGIYDGNGNLLAQTGSTLNVANVDNAANFATPLLLSPGRYYLALTPGNGTDTYARAAGLQATTNPITRSFTATNGSTGGTTPSLPPTLGGTTPSALAPALSAIVSGGL